jgi:tetratricopeptide (TPR) repeat protein
MFELRHFSDEQLLRIAREALKLGRHQQAMEFFSEYCDRQTRGEKPIPASVLASYGLAVGRNGDVKEGLDICFRALSSDRRNPDVYWSLAGLYLLSGSRKKAFDAIARGLGISPNNRPLLALQKEMGVRHAPPIPFLRRDSAVNVKLGKAIARLRPRAKETGSSA